MSVKVTDNQYLATADYQYRLDKADPFSHLTSSKLVGYHKKVCDCSTPHFHQTRKRGGVMPYNYVDMVTQTRSGRPCGFTVDITDSGSPWRSEQGQYWFDDTFLPVLPPIPDFDWNTVTFITNAAIARSRQGVFDVLTNLGELRETANMLKTLYTRIFDIAAYIARDARRHHVNSLDHDSVLYTFNRWWLEGRYGWRPLFSEAQKLAEALAKSYYTLVRAEGHSRAETILTETVAPLVSTASRMKITGTSTRTGVRTYRGFALSTGNISCADFRPLSTAWELTTLSFVVDRFIDIGGWISAIQPVPGLDTPARGFSVKDTWTETFEIQIEQNPAYPGTATKQLQSQLYQVETSQYRRFPRNATFPALYPRLDPLFVIDLVALALQRYGKVLGILHQR